MKYRKVLSLILCLVMISSLLSSCNETDNKKYIAVITKSTASQFWKSVYSGVNAASNEYNMKFTFEGPENEEDYTTQNAMIEKAINNKADVIVFSAIDYTKSTPLVEKAIDEGIPVVIIDSGINSDKVSVRISTDNYESGKMAGVKAIEFTEKQLNIGIVNFDVNSANGQQRELGFRDVIKTDSRANVLSAINVQSNIEDSTAKTKEMIKNNPLINVIVTFNEWTSLGVGYAIRDLGLSDKIKVIAFDNNVICIGMLETGEIDALVVQNPFAIGYLGAENAYKLLTDKKSVEKDIFTKTTLITKDNMYDKENQKILFNAS